MEHREIEARRRLVETSRRMNALGINQGTSGNLSCRWGGGLLITPSGIPYDAMEAQDIVELTFDGRCAAKQQPSSEWRFHAEILRTRREVGAVVHTHSPHATALAMRRMGIPAAHYMVAAAGGPDIRCARYATFGTQALSANALEALAGRRACLLANHGVIALGANLDRALWLAVEVEALARQYVLSLQLGGPVLLDEEEMARVIERFESYGPSSDP